MDVIGAVAAILADPLRCVVQGRDGEAFEAQAIGFFVLPPDFDLPVVSIATLGCTRQRTNGSSEELGII